jgi:hypothetical protein
VEANTESFGGKQLFEIAKPVFKAFLELPEVKEFIHDRKAAKAFASAWRTWLTSQEGAAQDFELYVMAVRSSTIFQFLVEAIARNDATAALRLLPTVWISLNDKFGRPDPDDDNLALAVRTKVLSDKVAFARWYEAEFVTELSRRFNDVMYASNEQIRVILDETRKLKAAIDDGRRTTVFLAIFVGLYALFHAGIDVLANMLGATNFFLHRPEVTSLGGATVISAFYGTLPGLRRRVAALFGQKATTDLTLPGDLERPVDGAATPSPTS